MTDLPGTVRRSPEGIVAVYRGPQKLRGDWGTSAPVEGLFDISDARVADWEIIHTPPPRPVGTVLRHRDEENYWWNLAIRTTSCWLFVDKCGMYSRSSHEPTGNWEVLFEEGLANSSRERSRQ